MVGVGRMELLHVVVGGGDLHRDLGVDGLDANHRAERGRVGRAAGDHPERAKNLLDVHPAAPEVGSNAADRRHVLLIDRDGHPFCAHA